MATFNNAKNVFAVINQDESKKEPLSKLLDEETLSKLAKFGSFYTILHDKFSESEGKEETVHRHVLIEGVETQSSSTWIALLSLLFDVPKNCVQIEAVKNLQKCGRYLVHRDDEFKFQFPKSEVQTNNLKQFEKWLMGGKITPQVLITYKGTELDFLKEFGAMAYKMWWPTLCHVQELRRREGEMSELDSLRAELESAQTALRDVKRDVLAIVAQTIAKTWPMSLLETNKALSRDVESFMYELQERIKNL